jgi:hypothetical protein
MGGWGKMWVWGGRQAISRHCPFNDWIGFEESVVGSPPHERAETGSGAALGPGREQDTSLPPSQPYQVPSIFLFFYIFIDACQCRATIHTVSVFLAVSREM